MSKSEEFIASFANLNEKISSAITDGSYGRVIELDKARQIMMQDLCLFSADDVDDQLFDFIEKCSRENTKMIEEMKNELSRMVKKTNATEKALKTYKMSIH